MKKYKTEFKLEVVQSFLAGEGGAKLLGELRSWTMKQQRRMPGNATYWAETQVTRDWRATWLLTKASKMR